MGMFLSLSGVIGKPSAMVINSLANYAKSVEGGLEKEQLHWQHTNCCVIEEANGNTTVSYPYSFSEWDKCSEFISKELNAPVFSCHIHDGDLWMYVLYADGKIEDQFNPIPDYWDSAVSGEEVDAMKGNAAIVAKYVKSIQPEEVEKYLVRWNPDEDGEKAYPDDVYTTEDWQLLDFLNKLGLPYPLDDADNVTGETYKLWTKEWSLEKTLIPVPYHWPQQSQVRRPGGSCGNTLVTM